MKVGDFLTITCSEDGKIVTFYDPKKGQLEEKKTGGPSNHIGTVMSKPNHTR